MSKKRVILAVLALMQISLLADGCVKEEPIDTECVMQIKDVGLREGVFVRRYKMTGDYGRQKSFSPEILKTFIKKVFESDYLLIQDAYDQGMHKEDQMQQRLEEYRMGILAANHPYQFENMTIPSEELHELYEKKFFKYDVDIVLANSFSMADSIYQYLKTGNNLDLPTRREDDLSFPKFFQYKDITYGEKLHFDLYPKLVTIKTGQISEPIFVSPNWAIIFLNKKSKNNDLKSFEQEKQQIAIQHHGLFKHKNNLQFLSELKNKYQVKIHTQYYQPLISAYSPINGRKWVDPNKINKSDLQDAFLEIDNIEISLNRFIVTFNMVNQANIFPSLTKKDLSHFVDNYINQHVLYLNALEKGTDNDVLVKDKLVNKEYRTLLSKYLKEEVAQKVVVTDADARLYYKNNRNKWTTEYKNVEKTVKFELRDKRLHEKKNELTENLKDKYKVRYNESLLKKVAEQLTDEKGGKSKDRNIQ